MIRLRPTGYAIFARVEGKKMVHPVVKHFDAEGAVDLVVHAKDGDLSVQVEKNVLMVHLRAGNTMDGSGARLV